MTPDEKWRWQMDWCKKKGYAPANSYFWKLSENALIEHLALIEYKKEDV